jgi:polygalacturonase
MADDRVLRRTFGRLALGGMPAAAVAAPKEKPSWRSGRVNVLDYGATAGGAALDTRAVQAAIDACAGAGGGTVCFPPGRYLSGTIVLRGNVALHFEPGAVLLGSRSLGDYPSHVPAMRSYTDNYTERSLIYAEKAENIAITGFGAIDGQGAAFGVGAPYKQRPYLIRLIECRNVTVADVTLRDSPMWVLHLLGCDDAAIRGVRVRSRVNHNNDGFDIDCSTRVRVSDCDIWSGDDAIVLKSTSSRPARDVTISNCVLSSLCNALKMGTESNGGFENIVIGNCAIYETKLAGVALEIVDGGTLDRVAVSNLVMNGVGAPLFLRLGNRARPFVEGGPRQPVGRMRNIVISNIEAAGAGRTGCAISGIPGHAIENVTFDNVRIRSLGGGTAADAGRQPAELESAYPEHSMFGVLPAYGFYCRHARNLRFRNVEIAAEEREERSALVCEDIDGLELDGCRLETPAGDQPAMRLKDVRGERIRT